jgi:hypothetical protein
VRLWAVALDPHGRPVGPGQNGRGHVAGGDVAAGGGQGVGVGGGEGAAVAVALLEVRQVNDVQRQLRQASMEPITS